MGVRNHPEYAEGIPVIPIIALAYVFLGIYYNLTVWYKLTDKTLYGAYITVAGAVITIILNYISIPLIGYMGSAWTTLICYGFMMIISYQQGQRHYPIPYAWKKLLAYITISVLVYFIYWGFSGMINNKRILLLTGFILLAGYVVFVSRIERKEFSRLPYLGKFFNTASPEAVAGASINDNMKA
jgi:O-antigen/teichoic acid export membrane protein